MNLIPRTSLLDHWFDRDFPGFRLLPEKHADSGLLAVDIRENDKGYTLKADFPGLKKEEIKVSIDNNVLTLSAEHKEEKEEKEAARVKLEPKFTAESRSRICWTSGTGSRTGSGSGFGSGSSGSE